ncbi:MAG TPA: potassium transporter TrkG, partial [Gammaproteobacteria bacterium]|nr:potassium transporter TrkG [Gammaproteobacteria bacterium]
IYASVGDAMQYSLFEVTSVITSTGFGISDFSVWPLFLPVLLIFISFIGGCGGSTAGGIKVIRILTLFKQAANQIFMLVYPRAVRPVKIGKRVLDDRTIQAIWGFFAVYIVIYAVLTLAMVASGMDQVTAFSAVAACINNLGPGLGDVRATFSSVNDSAKLVAIVAMLMGRLEIFTLLVIITPGYWRG